MADDDKPRLCATRRHIQVDEYTLANKTYEQRDCENRFCAYGWDGDFGILDADGIIESVMIRLRNRVW